MTNTQADTPSTNTGERSERSRLVLRSSTFRQTREQGWRDLEGLIARVEKRGIKALSAEELQRLPVLYRAALSSLSVARSIALDRNLLGYLETLGLRAFLVVYGPRTGLWHGVGVFFRRDFPRAVRAAGPHVVIACAALLVGVAAGFLLTHADEEWFTALVPSGLAAGRGPASSRAELLDAQILAPWPGFVEAFVAGVNYFFSHNTMVGVLTFSVGLAAGVPTVLLLVYQGLILGAFLAIHAHRDLTVEFVGWLSIHGVTELMAVVLCGAAGLMIAEKILFPDRYSRVHSLAVHGPVAARVVIGAVLLFLVAAVLEGGFRQLVHSTAWRYAIGGGTGALWLAYFLFTARERRG